MVDGLGFRSCSRKTRRKEAGLTSGSSQLEGPLGSTPNKRERESDSRCVAGGLLVLPRLRRGRLGFLTLHVHDCYRRMIPRDESRLVWSVLVWYN